MTARSRPRFRPSALALLLVTAGTAFSTPQDDPDPGFAKAYWHEAQGLQEAALAGYRKVARGGQGAWAKRAELRAAAIQESLLGGDLARLVPAETVLYAELREPGQRIGVLLDQLGLTGEGIELGDRRLAISPLLVRELLGLRGAAVALTSVEATGMPGGVALLDPGDLDVLRGLLETALPASGRAVDSIGGFDTWLVEGMIWVTLTHRLAIAGTSPELIGDVLTRLQGQSSLESLVDNTELASSLAMRRDGLAFACVNLEAMMPQIRLLASLAAREEPELAAAFDLLDVESARSLAASLVVSDLEVSTEIRLELDEDHRNLGFDLMRLPVLEVDALSSVPSGSVAFASIALNPIGELPSGYARVSAMDIGRELFGNLAQATAFVLPSNTAGSTIPDAGLCLRVNDLERSTQLWNTMLSLASIASGGASPAPVHVGGQSATRYQFEGVPLFVLPHANEIMLGTSASALTAAIEARHSETSVLSDPSYADLVSSLGESGNAVAGVHLGRLARFVQPYLEGDEAAIIAASANSLQGSTLALRMRQEASNLVISNVLRGIPDLAEVAEACFSEFDGRGWQVATR